MKIYVSRRDENVTAKLDEVYSNEQTVMLEYLTGDKAGKTTSITHSTLKRWWKETEVVEDETDASLELLGGGDSVEQSNTPVNEHKLVPMPGVEKLEGYFKPETDTEAELTDEQYAEIGLEIARQAKKKSKNNKDIADLECVIKELQDSGFNVSIVKGLPKTISIRTVGQLAVSKNGYRLKANLNFEFTTETPYELTKNYKKLMCDTLEDVLKVIQ